MPGIGLIQQIVGGIALAVILSLSLALFMADRRADKWEAQSLKCAAARVTDRNAYESAQREAAAKNKADVARVEAEQERITHAVTSDLTARLERLRSELRNAGPPAPEGSPGRPGAPGNGQPGTGTPEAPGVCLAPEELLRGAENEERHDQLITWVEKQLGIVR